MLKPFVLIVGPTASGKSALGLQLAAEFGAGILNCDSLQTYRRLDIGTAKPTLEERARVPHFLFDILNPGEILTAGDFRREALRVLDEQLVHRPIFGVGGSGFYIQALEKGMFDIDKPDPQIEERVRAETATKSSPELHAELTSLDPEYAESLNPNDRYRILRALIVMRDRGVRVSELRAQFRAQPFPYPLLKLGLNPDRESLAPRVRARTEAMLSAGLLDETRRLLDEGYREWPALQSVGYKECLAVLRGEIAESRLAELIVEKTLQLAKKQRTWFKRDSEIHWLPTAEPLARARELIQNILADV